MPNSKIDGGFGAERDAKSRVKALSPWSVRGVPREARSNVAKAAARRRETIGEWVTNALTQAANEELGIGPRREWSIDVPAGLPAEPEQGEPILDNALLAFAERFERSDKRNDAIAALTILAERLKSAEQREKSLLSMMQIVAERAERGEERIADVTRGLADIAVKLEAALNNNRMYTARNISHSVESPAIVTPNE